MRRARKQQKVRPDLRSLLSGGDRRSIGQSNNVVSFLEVHPEHARALIKLLWYQDPLVTMRAADALEKFTRDKPALLQRYKAQLLGLLAETTQQEVRWHLAAMVPRLRLTGAESRRVAHMLEAYLQDRSSIVKTFAMQGLADLSAQNASLRPEVTELIRSLTRSGTPAMRARGRHLLKQLET